VISPKGESVFAWNEALLEQVTKLQNKLLSLGGKGAGALEEIIEDREHKDRFGAAKFAVEQVVGKPGEKTKEKTDNRKSAVDVIRKILDEGGGSDC
jgi:hypothetical protein